MAQFDVHRNVGGHKDAIPFVVVAQSRLFDDYRRRVVIPLVRKAAQSCAKQDSQSTPESQLQG